MGGDADSFDQARNKAHEEEQEVDPVKCGLQVYESTTPLPMITVPRIFQNLFEEDYGRNLAQFRESQLARADIAESEEAYQVVIVRPLLWGVPVIPKTFDFSKMSL